MHAVLYEYHGIFQALPSLYLLCVIRQGTHKNVSSVCIYHIFFQQKILEYISVYAMFNDQSFNDTLTNDIVSFEQMSPDIAIHL